MGESLNVGHLRLQAWTAAVSGLVSVMALSVMLLHLYLYYSSQKDKRILRLLAIELFIASILKALGSSFPQSDTFCRFQGSVVEFVDISSSVLYLGLSLNFWFVLSKGIVPPFLEPFVLTSASFLLVIIANKFNAFSNGQDTALWCKFDAKSDVLSYTIYYIFMYLILFLAIGFTIAGIVKIFSKERVSGLNSYQYSRAASKSLLYSCSMLCTSLPGTMDRIAELVLKDQSVPFWIDYLNALISPLDGLFLAVVYFLLLAYRSKNASSGSAGSAGSFAANPVKKV